MGIRFKLLIPLLALALLFLLGFKLVVWPNYLDTQLKQRIVDEHNRLEILGTALIHPLRNSDLAQIHSILDSVLENHAHWRHVRLTDVDRVLIYPFNEAVPPRGEQMVELQHSITFFRAPVGELRVTIDMQPIYLQHDRFARHSEILVVVLLVVSILGGIPLQERLITRPLRSLAAAARKMASGNFEAYLPKAGRDEVGQLIHSFRGMREEVKNYQARLHEMAHHDVLTGLPNRMMFLDRLEHAIAHAHRYGKPLGLLFLDVDNFKAINDTLGHATGDALVVSLARRLTSITREGDTVARLGGDEFTIIVEIMNHVDEAEATAQKIVNAFRTPLQVDGHEIPVTVSIGITTYPRDSTEVTALVQNADIAMYRAKAVGGGTLCRYSDEERILDRTALEIRSKLYYALEKKQYSLQYQPRINLRSGRVDCVEALLRWQPSPGETLVPTEFIPLLEQNGLIVDVGEWVLRESCRFIRDQLDRDGPVEGVSVNLSARQFRDTHLLSKIESTLNEYDVPAHYLELELTEGAIMENTLAALSVLDALHDMGVHLSIDDFGTGYSSLSYLKRFPVDYLKIDRSFITDLPGDCDDMTIVSAIIALAKNLGILTIAEGVETAQQAEFLEREGCAVVQGFLYSEPLDDREVLTWIDDYHRKVPA